MRFETIAAPSAVGAVLAHSHRLAGGAMLKKGHVVTDADVRALGEGGVERVTVAILEAHDVAEDEAARRVAEAIVASRTTAAATTSFDANVKVAKAITGRANIFARERGVVVIAREGLDAINLIDEAITVATIPPYSVAEASSMVATVKIIPFAVADSLVTRACDAASSSNERPLLSVAPFRKKRAGLVLTQIPGVHEGKGDKEKTSEAQRLRMAYVGGELVREVRVAHETGEVAAAIDSFLAEGLDLVLVLGASAIVDRKDVVPAAIEAVGGAVDHLGMPVDPGNLLLLGHKGATPIVGVPGCARSIRRSGFDWVLERLAADVAVSRTDIMRLGAGGLLADVPSRPAPRAAPPVTTTPAAKTPRVAAIVLAAGLSRRMNGANKLVEPVDGAPIVARVVDELLASKAKEVLVVVGHRQEEIRAALGGRAVRLVENPAFEEGLGASLRAGIQALGDAPDLDGALIALGDMPWIRAAHVDTLIAAFDPNGPQSICVPVHDRKRGHPVLWSKRHFAEMKKLGGDEGARSLLERHADEVKPVTIDDAGIHVDIDTPEMLAIARKKTRVDT